MLRAYQDLLKINPDRKYLQAFAICADEAILHNLSAIGIMGIEKPAALVNQAGMLEIMARLALVEKQ